MKVTPHYGDSVITLPGNILSYLRGDGAKYAPVLIYAAGNEEFTVSRAAEALEITEDEVLAAIKFWETTGVVSATITSFKEKNKKRKETELSDTIQIPNEKKRRGKLSPRLPAYTSAETAAFLESRDGVALLIDSCEQIIGKIFTAAEVGIIVGMMDHLSLSSEYILLLFAHAAKIGKKNVRYIERLAVELSDRDVTEYNALTEELSSREKTESAVSFVRRLYGLGERALTEKEKGMIKKWCSDWGYGDDVIGRAYEITVDNTGEAPLSYTNAVLERWHESGLKSLSDIDADIEKYKNERAAKDERKRSGRKKSASEESARSPSSFDTDEFFEAAIERSYGESPNTF